MNRWWIAALLCLCAYYGSEARADASVYTRVKGSGCVDFSKAQLDAWRCAGPSGFFAEFFDEGNVAGVRIRHASVSSAQASQISFRGVGRVFGDLLEWRLEAGNPKAAILRIWRAETAPDHADRATGELAVLKVTLRETCVVGLLDARRPDSNSAARVMAMTAQSLPCIDLT